MPQSFIKTPSATIDFTINWDDGYLTTGEFLSTSSWAIQPASTSFSINTEAYTTATATIDVMGGVQGQTYYLKNTIVTSAGRIDTRTLQVDIWGPR